VESAEFIFKVDRDVRTFVAVLNLMSLEYVYVLSSACLHGILSLNISHELCVLVTKRENKINTKRDLSKRSTKGGEGHWKRHSEGMGDWLSKRKEGTVMERAIRGIDLRERQAVKDKVYNASCVCQLSGEVVEARRF
jgi:hypothetical protein